MDTPPSTANIVLHKAVAKYYLLFSVFMHATLHYYNCARRPPARAYAMLCYAMLCYAMDALQPAPMLCYAMDALQPAPPPLGAPS